MKLFLQSPQGLSDKQVAEVYALAEQHSVSICLYGGTQSPSRGPAEWLANGSTVALRSFASEAKMNVITEPQYPKFRWTDKTRWE